MSIESIVNNKTSIKQNLTIEDFSFIANEINKTKSEIESLSKINNRANSRNNKNKNNKSSKTRKNETWILNEKEQTESEKNDVLESYYDSLVFLLYPLLLKSLSTLFAKEPMVDMNENLYSVLLAGIEGIKKGALKYNNKQDSGTSVHYIMQWFNTYAKRDIEKIAASNLGINASKYATFKKIAAVRMQLENDLGREPTNQEILQYFHSGKADKSLFSSKSKPKDGGVFKSNNSITEEDIIEQQNIYVSNFYYDINVSDMKGELN